jgi:hypothetical protein
MAGEDALEPSRRVVIPVNIDNGGTTSNAVDMTNFILSGVYIPTVFTGTTLTFLAANPAAKDKDKADYFSLNDSAGAAVSVTVAGQRFVAFTQAIAELFKSVQYLKVVSGSAEGAARTIYLIGTVKL